MTVSMEWFMFMFDSGGSVFMPKEHVRKVAEIEVGPDIARDVERWAKKAKTGDKYKTNRFTIKKVK